MAIFDGTFTGLAPTFDGASASGGGSGGGKSQTMQWGAYLSSTNLFMDAFSRGSGSGVVAGTPNEESICIALFSGTISKVGLALSSSNTNQDWGLYVNGTLQATVEPTATETYHAATYSVSVSVSEGDEVSVKLVSGSGSAETMVTALLEE